MAIDDRISDGTFSWYGGMDSSRTAYDIDVDQYVKGINVAITTVGDNLTPRPGWAYQHIHFDSDLSEDQFNKNVQGAAWYFDGERDCLVISVAGLVYYGAERSNGTWDFKVINRGDPNNPTKTKVWTCPLPNNTIVLSDGQKLPMVIGLGGEYRRTDPNKGEMGVCRMMAYVQNRLWWVDEFGSFIYGSDIVDPLSIQEAIDTNIFGFVPPDPREKVTAIGSQRYLNLDQNGGELIFSTERNIYAVDVRGDRQLWGASGRQGTGFVRLVIPDVGATSQYSFTNYNANLYYRSRHFGLVNYNQVQSQFANSDTMISSSVEVNNWFGQDTEWMLDQCWTVNYKGRLLTTTYPHLVDGYVCWNGVVSMNPAPFYGPKIRLPRRFEGLWTGVQPWCLIHQTSTFEEKLFTVSRDSDAVNRLYLLTDNQQFDVGPQGRKEIESVVETRAYSFKRPEVNKTFTDRYYSLDRIKTDVAVAVSSRSTPKGRWFPFYSITHYLPKCLRDCLCLPFNPVMEEPRNSNYLSREKEDQCESKFAKGGSSVKSREYRLEFKGIMELSSFAVIAKMEPESSSTQCSESPDREPFPLFCPPKDFSYRIVTQPPPTNAGLSNTSSEGGDSKCGC